MPTATRLGTPFVLALVAALALAGATAAEPPRISSKRAQAEAVLAEIHAIDLQLGAAVEAWNGATLRLDEIEADLAANEKRLRIARASLKRAHDAAAERLVTLYVTGEPDTVEFLLGASSLADLVDRFETAQRIAEDDARIAREVSRYEREVERRRQLLRQARTEQRQVVAERAARRDEIERRLGERRALYESVQAEIAVLEEEERRRAERLAAEARRQAAALERERAEEGGRSADEPAAQESGGGSGGGSGSGGGAPSPPPTPAPAPQPSPAPSPPPAGPGHPEVVSIALRYLGIPYRWGGASPSTGFDCSGFVMYVYAKIGISLPHHAASQYRYGRPVSRSQLRPGDLVFFNGLGHNGIYIGGGNFVHSPHTGDVVKVSSLWSSWYSSTWVGGRRL